MLQEASAVDAPSEDRPDVVERPGGTWQAIELAVVAGVVLAGLVLRFWTRSDLWLDEALSVNIARLPLGHIAGALTHDGHPPLYYYLLHLWMLVFGSGDEAVRALSGVFAVATLPLLWLAARRIGGRAAALAGLVVLASSPFAVRYATEARMYSLVALLVTAGWLAVRWALDETSLGRLAAVAVISGLLLLTHYWAFYLVAAVVVCLAFAAWRATGEARSRLLRVGIAVVVGGVLFVPWLPSFLEQAKNTGTPWGGPARPALVLQLMLTDWGGGPFPEAQLLGTILAVFAVLGVLGRRLDADRIEIDLRGRREGLPEAVIVILTLVLAIVAGYATRSAFATRYTAIVLPLVLLMTAVGIGLIGRRTTRVAILVFLALVGLFFCGRNVTTNRTQAGQVAAAVRRRAQPGDLVVYCPDQLGPAVSRLLPSDLGGSVFPSGRAPQRVDWVKYADRMHAGSPKAFAAAVDTAAGSHTIWLVWAGGYRTLDQKCETLNAWLKQRRPTGKSVVDSNRLFEHANLYRYPR